MIAVLIAAFIVYLYTPHLLFRSAVTSQYELIVRKGLPQVEEFFAAAFPSVFLNLQAFVLMNAATLIVSRSWFVIDRCAIAPLFVEKPDASKLIAHGDLLPTILYLFVLGGLSWWTGFRYGKLLTRIAKAGGPEDYFKGFTGIHRVPAALAVLRYRFWQTFYAQYEQRLVPSVIRQDRVFVRTKDRLYHGKMFCIYYAPDGEISGILLTEASKLALDEDEFIAHGKSPIVKLDGPFLLRWSEVTDIDYPQIDVLARMRHRYALRLRRRRKKLSYRLAAAVRLLRRR
ncbi:MAG: hypothetical protein M3P29_10105 [Acidobacteriota bacterium]|nr:hypothetical protein [Acidobacteriota bacterium]